MPRRAPHPDDFLYARVLFDLRFRDGWSCPRCGHRGFCQLRCRPRMFSCNRCGEAESVTAGTALHRCRLPLQKVVLAAFAISLEPSISARALARLVEVCVETGWTLGHRLRCGFLPQVEARLEGEVFLSPCAFHLRPPPRIKGAKFVRFGAVFRILWDRTERMAVETGRHEAHALRRFVDRFADREAPIGFGLMTQFQPRKVGNGVHRGVSDRWLPLYVASLAAWNNLRRTGHGDDTALVTLRATLACPKHPFRDLRPRAPPRPVGVWWRQDAGIALLRSWGRLPAPVPDG